MKKRLLFTSILVLILISLPITVLAQTYFFSVDEMLVDVYWNEDGTEDILYSITFSNSPSADPIDFIDIGIPNPNYNLNNVNAEVDGQAITNIESSPYVDNGVALGLGSNAIQPGERGTVRILVTGITRVLFQDDSDPNYASAVFSTTFFDRDFVDGTTRTVVTFHLPPGVQPEEPRWHDAPGGFPDEPVAGFDEQGRITYSWENPNASATTDYRFGASFPRVYVLAETISTPTLSDRLQIPWESIIGSLFCLGFGGFFILIIVFAFVSSRKRQLQYMPPKISIEGHGIKRGLTAVEAAILMEQPMDKIMTMILFAVVKKGAASVKTRDPLAITPTIPAPEDLRDYEVGFIHAFALEGKARRTALQDTMVDLVKTVSQKMKGFSRRETITYYEEIMKKAWAQVRAADTPEVVSKTLDDNMEWTMLDENWEGRTKDVFQSRPVFVPNWWGRYDPTYGGGTTTIPTTGGGGLSKPSTGGGGPSLPGADFAATIAGGIENFSSSVIGNVSEFTGGITNKTNPVPVTTTTRSGGGGRSGGGCACACACACAGCACACAGGGR